MHQQAFTWSSEDEKKQAFLEAKALSERNASEYWAKEAMRLHWQKPFTQIFNGEFAKAQWFSDGLLNVSENCLDVHVRNGLKDKKAIIWENEDGHQETYTYGRLLELTKQIAALMLRHGIAPSDRVAIYMPMTPHAVATMLACARIGAIHTVVFAGFSKESLIDRITDAKAKLVITSVCGQRRGQKIPLFATVKNAVEGLSPCSVTSVICFDAAERQTLSNGVDVVPFEESKEIPLRVENPVGFPAEHPLFILYTSGTTGKPKGIFHSSGGYLTAITSTCHWVFDFKPDDIYWCTADVGWITGHSYITYGPLACGATLFLYDGALNYPNTDQVYRLLEKHEITIFYTSPTAIRMFMAQGEDLASRYDLSSIRLLGSVGEPISATAWLWYQQIFGRRVCPVIDTWWQTETGAMMITSIPGISKLKPGSATKPLLGVDAKIVDDHGKEVPLGQSGYLILTKCWPSIARGIWGDQERFFETYLARFPGAYFCGDGAKIDEDGDFLISGRIDDVVNVSGHRLGTAEIESALGSHPDVVESAVVGVPDEITGSKLVAFVIARTGASNDVHAEQDLIKHVAKTIGSFAKPKAIHFVKSLPKTRSGKIMRRLLKAIASGEKVTSDVSTLEDPTWAKTNL